MSLSYPDLLNKLVFEMGFSQAEANMALQDSGGNLDQAVEKLLAGAYAPPPYNSLEAVCTNDVRIEEKGNPNVFVDDDQETSSSTRNKIANFFGDLTRENVKPPIHPKEDSSAPSFYDLTSQLNNLPPTAKQMPPPYEIVEKHKKVENWEKEFNVSHIDLSGNTPTLSLSGPTEQIRCAVCFSMLQKLEKDILIQNSKYYHEQCFRKKFGPKCAHCCFPLSQPDKDHDLSGRFLVYDNKDYHVECYEKYAGPRCSFCCNVIIAKPNGEYNGGWIVDGNYQYHTECYQKKMQNYWKAKNS